MIKRIETLTFTPTTREIAQEFCDMGGDEQAEIFNEIAIISKGWPSPFCFQAQSITDSKKLTDDGRKIMSVIGEYSSKQP